MPTVCNSGLKKYMCSAKHIHLTDWSRTWGYRERQVTAISMGLSILWHHRHLLVSWWNTLALQGSWINSISQGMRPSEQLILNPNWVYPEWLLAQIYSREIWFVKKKNLTFPFRYIIVLQGSWNIQILKWFAWVKSI